MTRRFLTVLFISAILLAAGCQQELPREKSDKLVLPAEFKAIDAPNDDGSAILLVWPVSPSDNIRPKVIEKVAKEKSKKIITKLNITNKTVNEIIEKIVVDKTNEHYASQPQVKYILSISNTGKGDWNVIEGGEVDSNKSYASENIKYFGTKDENEMLHYVEVKQPYEKLVTEEKQLTELIINTNTEIEKIQTILREDINELQSEIKELQKEKDNLSKQLEQITVNRVEPDKQIAQLEASIANFDADFAKALQEPQAKVEEAKKLLDKNKQERREKLEPTIASLIEIGDILELFEKSLDSETKISTDKLREKQRLAEEQVAKLALESDGEIIKLEGEVESAIENFKEAERKERLKLNENKKAIIAGKKPLSKQLERINKDESSLTQGLESISSAIKNKEESINLLKNMKETQQKLEQQKEIVAKVRIDREKVKEQMNNPALKKFFYKLEETDGQQTLTYPQIVSAIPEPNWANWSRVNNFILMIIFSAVVMLFIARAKRNPNLFIRKINGLDAVDEAVGRATEMGKPIFYFTGLGGMGELPTIASTNILGRVARKVAQHDSQIKVPCNDPIVMSVCQEVVKESYTSAGRPDAYREDNVFFVSNEQFSFTAAADGMMMREKPATNIYLGSFFAEALLLTEAGSGIGAIQIAGTDALAQLPFFVTTCDYTLIGEELYAASAYLSREPILLGSLKGQDAGKLFLIVIVIIGTALSTVGINFLTNLFKAL